MQIWKKNCEADVQMTQVSATRDCGSRKYAEMANVAKCARGQFGNRGLLKSETYLNYACYKPEFFPIKTYICVMCLLQ